jgi:ABC-type Mn2+/Zn2+ transport system ATPase subunit
LVQQNSYPLKDWHFEHMQKTIVKFVSGLSELESGSSWKRKQHKKYSGNIGYVRRNINFDIKHGVTREEVIAFLDKVRNDSSFSNIRKSAGSKERLEQLQIEK